MRRRNFRRRWRRSSKRRSASNSIWRHRCGRSAIRAPGHLLKKSYGPWAMRAFGVLAKLRFLRGSALDPFGRTEERRAERRLIGEYEALVEEILQKLSPETLATSVALASLPEKIRGFGHVKEKSIRAAEAEKARLLDRLRLPEVKLAAD